MTFENICLPKGGVMGCLAKARRISDCREAPKFKARANRKMRRAVRQVLKSGDDKQVRGFRPMTSWDLV